MHETAVAVAATATATATATAAAAAAADPAFLVAAEVAMWGRAGSGAAAPRMRALLI